MGVKCKKCKKAKSEKFFNRTFAGPMSKVCMECEENKPEIVRLKAYTYLIRCLKNNLVKIGKSSDVKRRLNQIKSEEGQCYMIGYCDKNIEQQLHRAYKEQNIRGEWFDLSNEMLSKILSDNIWK